MTLFVKAGGVRQTHKGYYMAAPRYEISRRVLKLISRVSAANEWNIFQHEKRNFVSPRRPCNILYLSFSSADVRGSGTRDETLRTSAWEAISSRGFSWFPTFGPALCCQHFLCFILRNRSIQMTVVHVSKACGSSCLLRRELLIPPLLLKKS